MWKNIPGGRLSLSELLGIHSLETFKLSVTPANVQCRILTFTCLLEDKLETESPVGTNHSMSRKASLKIISPCSLFQRHAAARFSSEAAAGKQDVSGNPARAHSSTRQLGGCLPCGLGFLFALRPGASVVLSSNARARYSGPAQRGQTPCSDGHPSCSVLPVSNRCFQSSFPEAPK